MTTSDPTILTLAFTTSGTPPTTLTPPYAVVEAIVGETISFAAQYPTGTLVGTVASAPAGSSTPTTGWGGGTSGTALTIDVAGAYFVNVTNGSNPTMKVKLVAFPASALTFPQVADAAQWKRSHPSMTVAAEPRDVAGMRRCLRSIASGSMGAFSDATFAALTTGAPIPTGLDLKSLPS